MNRFVTSSSSGRISVDDLFEAFKDKGTFKHIKNPYSVVNKLVLSPFFQNFEFSHNQVKNEKIDEIDDIDSLLDC